MIEQLLILTLVAGGSIPLGALLAYGLDGGESWLQTELRHTVIASGGGVLLAAVALVLVPEGSEALSLWPAMLAMLAGGLVFCLIDVALVKSELPASQLVALLADFLPEALALGAMLAGQSEQALLLALLIALQNLPEGFNAFQELVSSRQPAKPYRNRRAQGLPLFKVLGLFLLLVPLGPVAAMLGWALLADEPAILGGIMLFAAGGILYIVFQDIAPQAKLERHWAPSLGAVAGFLVGLAGYMLLHAG